MIINGKEVVAIELFGEGYYSGSVASHLGFMLKQDYLKYKEEIESYIPYFSELDGKHSETEGEVFVHELDNEIAAAYVRMTDDWLFYECLIEHAIQDYEVDFDVEHSRLKTFSEEIMSVFSMSTVTTVEIEDKVIVVKSNCWKEAND